MIIFTLKVTQAHRDSFTVSVSDSQMYALEVGLVGGHEIEFIDVRVSGTEELLYRIPGKFHYLFKKTKTRYDYIVCNYKTAVKQMLIERRALGFMTQAEIAEHYQVWACRIAIFEDLGWLKADHKQSRTLMYLRADVLDLTQRPDFNTWLNNQYERVGRIRKAA